MCLITNSCREQSSVTTADFMNPPLLYISLTPTMFSSEEKLSHIISYDPIYEHGTLGSSTIVVSASDDKQLAPDPPPPILSRYSRYI